MPRNAPTPMQTVKIAISVRMLEPRQKGDWLAGFPTRPNIPARPGAWRFATVPWMQRAGVVAACRQCGNRVPNFIEFSARRSVFEDGMFIAPPDIQYSEPGTYPGPSRQHIPRWR